MFGTSIKKRSVLCALLLTAAIICKFTLPHDAEYLRNLISGNGNDPVTMACSAFQNTVSDGGNWKDGVAAFCEGFAEYYEEH